MTSSGIFRGNKLSRMTAFEIFRGIKLLPKIRENAKVSSFKVSSYCNRKIVYLNSSFRSLINCQHFFLAKSNMAG